MQKTDIITEEFFKYLTKNGVSSSTIKNYKSDIKHFSDWIIRSVKSLGVFAETLSEAAPFINNSTAGTYKTFLENSGAPVKTINRKLSTLRKLSSFLFESQVLQFNFSSQVKNIQIETTPKINPGNNVDQIITDFQTYLEKEKVSKNTIKNYLSDIRQFFSWMSNSQNLHN